MKPVMLECRSVDCIHNIDSEGKTSGHCTANMVVIDEDQNCDDYEEDDEEKP